MKRAKNNIVNPIELKKEQLRYKLSKTINSKYLTEAQKKVIQKLVGDYETLEVIGKKQKYSYAALDLGLLKSSGVIIIRYPEAAKPYTDDDTIPLGLVEITKTIAQHMLKIDPEKHMKYYTHGKGTADEKQIIVTREWYGEDGPNPQKDYFIIDPGKPYARVALPYKYVLFLATYGDRPSWSSQFKKYTH